MNSGVLEVLQQGPVTSRAIQAATGLSQAAVSRKLRGLGERVIRLKEGRSVRYALSRNAFGADDRLPLYRVDPHGNTVCIAHLRPLAHGGFFVQALAGMPTVLLGESGTGLYDDLPYFLDDLRPQGFLGRQIAREMARLSPDFPDDPRYWNADHVGRYLLSNGDDLPGNLKIGPQTHLRVRHPPPVVDPDAYPRTADAVMSGRIPGSSAGGERPKFTACTAERGHVIVKFSPPGDGAVERRWRDVLLTEYHATEAIRSVNLAAAETRLLELGGRLFLESQRFDRSGEFGRLPMLSLQAVDAEFSGLGSNWPAAMQALADQQLVSPQHALDTLTLWTFGRLINNSDMHLGNLSLAFEGDIFRLLPVYDMCSMGFAPNSGEVAPLSFSPPNAGLDPISKPATTPEWQAVAWSMADTFWHSLADDPRLSPEFRRFLDDSGLPEQIRRQRARGTTVSVTAAGLQLRPGPPVQ